MAICYNCNESFYGKLCWHCGRPVIYKCWNCFYDSINGDEDEECSLCKWYICPMCDHCGCQINRPLSNEEKRNKINI